ncbi:hypothetical protein LTR64_000554 [Lithohypha guttulata]|uniref:uncharacterized protein n=1 Tax=Lithohypha guttulata TaxID=1690604 RepID=UPI002DE0C3D6|nr:hypothetical protein LTR51_005680 [Lithohypha guttulata]
MGTSWLEVLEDPLTRKLLGHEATLAEKVPFVAGVQQRLKFLLQDPLKHLSLAKIGYSALEAFLQANCTGPPLEFDPATVIFPESYRDDIPEIKKEMLKSLTTDGIDAYSLVPQVELFWLAKSILDNDTLAGEGFNGRRARFRVHCWHQKLLLEQSDTLQDAIFGDAAILESQLASRLAHGGAAAQDHMVEFHIERANIRIFYGHDTAARQDLVQASKLRGFEFALTGALGKKTKFQEKEISQLVVIARSNDIEHELDSTGVASSADEASRLENPAANHAGQYPAQSEDPRPIAENMSNILNTNGTLNRDNAAKPENILLNDDTLLENIQFSNHTANTPDPTTNIIADRAYLPPSLASVDPADQPKLQPIDSIILLAIASSITNTQASSGLTREETTPYATRVLEGGSSNWSVYSQGLLVRSRIEGYRSRTAERGLLQLQALVDQVIAETASDTVTSRTDGEADSSNPASASSFLPKPTKEEGASVAERLQFVHQLQPPFRWDLEAELASRWVAMGGLKTALEIYERLQMHAEIALCLAATDREAEAVAHLKRLLFVAPDQVMQDGDVVSLNKPLPAESPRLLCILGDIQQEPKYYVLAWTVSEHRYARAQRSLGRFYLKKHDLSAAVEAFTAALRISRQDLATWFSLGCVYLELEHWQLAVEAFTKVVQLEDKDAQGWSNLAVALLRLPSPKPSPTVEGTTVHDDEEDQPTFDPLQHTLEALRALRRAAQLKREDARIWDNYLTVAASIPPNPEHPERGTPWQEVLHAMSQVITLRHKKEGESCVDLKILEALVDHITAAWDYPSSEDESTATKADQLMQTSDGGTIVSAVHRLPFLVRALTTLINGQITTLAISSPQLFLLLSKVALWRRRPAESLALIEKSWRATGNLPDPSSTELTKSTEILVNAYRTLGPMERERTGGLVEKGWRFKARSGVRSTIGRLKTKGEEDTEEYEQLTRLLEDLKVDKQES